MNPKLKLTLLIALVVTAIGVLTACTGQPEEAQKSPTPDERETSSYSAHAVPETIKVIDQFEGVLEPGKVYRAVVEMAKGGEFELVFFPEVAPNHVANFVSLARKGFYNDVTFHRVIEGFMAQGGDPTGTGSGGPGYTIPAEFSNLPHKRGTLSMARLPDPNSAGSQFFITFQRTPMLDNEYTVFGEVIRGMDVVDNIRRRDPQSDPHPGDAISRVTIIEEEVSS